MNVKLMLKIKYIAHRCFFVIVIIIPMQKQLAQTPSSS